MIKEEDENEDEESSSDKSTKQKKQIDETKGQTFKKAPIRKRSSS